MNLEAIYAALFALASQGVQWKTQSRRLQLWGDVAPPMQPAFFQAQGMITAHFTQKQDTIWILQADLYIYAHTQGTLDDAPSQVLNPLVQQVITNLLPSQLTGEQTLGGLVTSCRIDGDIITDEGVLGDQAVAIIPVKMLVPQNL